MKLKLQARYSIILCTVTLTAVIAMAIVLLQQYRNSSAQMRELGVEALQANLIEQMVEHGEIMASNLARNLVIPLYRLDMLAMYTVTAETRALPDVEYVYVVDSENRIVHDATREISEYGHLWEPPIDGSAGESYGENAYRYADLLIVSSNVTLGNDRLGAVRLALSLEPVLAQTVSIREELDRTLSRGVAMHMWSIGMSGVALLLAGFLAAIPVSRSLARPIRELASYAATIGRGRYDQPLKLSRGDEIGDLAQSLRDMGRNLRSMTAEAQFLAYHDSLTNLPNRVHLKQHLGQLIAQIGASRRCFALFFIDLDDFKRVNDTLGHDAGDNLLKICAERLRDSLHFERQDASSDITNGESFVARLGGDEFTFVVDGLETPAAASRYAENVLQTLQQPMMLNGQQVVVGASIGIAVCPDDGDEIGTLLRKADVAMYQAKQAGKNKCRFYSDSMDRTAVERLSLESDLRYAVTNAEFMLRYQPIVNPATGDVVCIEALTRWQHPALGELLPAMFIPLAEETGAIAGIDEWAIRVACRDLAWLRERSLGDMPVAVNLSSLHLRQDRIVRDIERSLLEYKLEPCDLHIEVSEKTIMRNATKSRRVLHELHDRGIAVWIDGFGAGHSPLNQLARLPVSGLKIDNDLVTGLAESDSERTIIKAIAGLGHSLDLEVVAEGVENGRQLNFLNEMNCDYAQGHLFAAPMSLNDLLIYLERHAGRRNRPNATQALNA